MIAKRYALAILVFFMPVLMLGCAKRVGDDNVENIALTIQDGAEFLTSQGLVLLERYQPDSIEAVRGDLASIIVIAQLYEDGSASVGDVANTITAVLSRVNERFQLLPEDTAMLVEGAINFLSRQVSRYFNEATLPADAARYVAGFAEGVRLGLK